MKRELTYLQSGTVTAQIEDSKEQRWLAASFAALAIRA